MYNPNFNGGFEVLIHKATGRQVFVVEYVKDCITELPSGIKFSDQIVRIEDVHDSTGEWTTTCRWTELQSASENDMSWV